MNKEDFKQTLISQYSEVIEELIVESETVYRSQLDFSELDFRIKTLIQAARIDGLEETVIWDILERKVPDYYHYAMRSSYKIAA